MELKVGGITNVVITERKYFQPWFAKRQQNSDLALSATTQTFTLKSTLNTNTIIGEN